MGGKASLAAPSPAELTLGDLSHFMGEVSRTGMLFLFGMRTP